MKLIEQQRSSKRSALELRHFRYFVVLAEELHFGRAAARLNIVQPALSAQVKALEEIIGVKLLERTKRRVALTEAGRQFWKDGVVAMAAVDQAAATALHHARGAIGKVTIGYGANAALSGIMPQAIKRFRALWPDVVVDLVEMASGEVVDAISTGLIDIGYAAAPATETPIRLNTQSVGSWPWVLAVSTDHPLVGKTPVRRDDVKNEKLAVYGEPGGRVDLSTLLSVMPHINLDQVHRSDRFANLMTYVASGLGVAFVPSSIGEVAFPGVRFLSVESAFPQMEMYLLWSKEGASVVVNNFVASTKQT